jgi:hypothetical protein
MADPKHLRIYLNDHLLTASAAAGVARRAARSKQGTALGEQLSTIAADLADDLAQLERIMRERHIRPNPVKRTLGRLGERAGLLKLNGSVTSASPLTPLVELEGLTMLLSHNASLWRSLETIGIEATGGLAERVEGHIEALAALRRAAASRALVDGEVE